MTPSRSLNFPSASRTPMGTALPASALPERAAHPGARPGQPDVDVVLVRLRVVHVLAPLSALGVAGGVGTHSVGARPPRAAVPDDLLDRHPGGAPRGGRPASMRRGASQGGCAEAHPPCIGTISRAR